MHVAWKKDVRGDFVVSVHVTVGVANHWVAGMYCCIVRPVVCLATFDPPMKLHVCAVPNNTPNVGARTTLGRWMDAYELRHGQLKVAGLLRALGGKERAAPVCRP